MNKEAGISHDQIQNLMMPFGNPSGQNTQGYKSSSNDLSFFNKKVFKPIRGGGAGAQKQEGGIDFKNFMMQQN